MNVYRTMAARLAAAASCAALLALAPGVVAAEEAGPPGEGVRAGDGRVMVETEGKELRAGDGCVSVSGPGKDVRVGDCARDDDAPREPGGGGSAAAGPGSPASGGPEKGTERCVSRITQRSNSGEATTEEKTTGEKCRGRSVVTGAGDPTQRTARQGDPTEDAGPRTSGSEETLPEITVPGETTVPRDGGDPASGADQYEETPPEATVPGATVGKPSLEERTDPETAPGQVVEETRITTPAPEEPEDNGREETTAGIAIPDEPGSDATSPGPAGAPGSAGEEQYAEPTLPESSEGSGTVPDETPAEDAYEEDVPTAQLPVRPGPQGPVSVLPETGGIGLASLLTGTCLVAVSAVLGLRGRGGGEEDH